jgi:DMSO reductase anchor subunit
MHPAFSVIFLTTLIGVGQGLFLALYTGQVYSLAKLLPAQSSQGFYALGSAVAMVLLIGGLIASFFHLGHPERAWRAMTQWRTSWLSREVIVLPIFMAMVFLYALVHFMQWTSPLFVVADTLAVDLTLIVGLLGSIAAFALFLSTAMIYASLKFLQEWHTPLTVVNYTFLGLASGFMLAAAFSAYSGVGLVAFFGTWAVIFTLIAAVGRVASLMRNKRLRPKIDLTSAIGVRHPHSVQLTQGFMGGSFNTREFFHHKSAFFVNGMRRVFLALVFVIPVGLIIASYFMQSELLPLVAFVVQYIGLLAERWYFFAEAKHPQNLYYQQIS